MNTAHAIETPRQIDTMPIHAHACPTCGEPAWYHQQCIRCRPLHLCDYCDAPALAGDPDHACAKCRAEIDEDQRLEEIARREALLQRLLARHLTDRDFSLLAALLANYRISLGAALKRERDLTDAGRARYQADIAEAEALAAKLTEWDAA